MTYTPSERRYDILPYRRCGKSGLLLPALSLGLWHNFGDITPFGIQRTLLCTAFDNGITHFDLANNYGPPYGEAERNFGIHMKRDWRPFRDEMIISTKAGYDMRPGPYGDHGSRKYIISSLDQSLRRMNLDYVDIFYHHRPDPDTPIEETMLALHDIRRSGKALYVAISNYDANQTSAAVKVLREMGTPLLVHQANYNMFNRWIEEGLKDVLRHEGAGCAAFSPLAGGITTSRYLSGVPSDSRAGHDPRYLKPTDITDEKLEIARRLNDMAARRGQSLAQMALLWVLRDDIVASAIIGASKPEQILENIDALKAPVLSETELNLIDDILLGVN